MNRERSPITGKKFSDSMAGTGKEKRKRKENPVGTEKEKALKRIRVPIIRPVKRILLLHLTTEPILIIPRLPDRIKVLTKNLEINPTPIPPPDPCRTDHHMRINSSLQNTNSARKVTCVCSVAINIKPKTVTSIKTKTVKVKPRRLNR
jgi:hypothetical protein